MNIPRTIIFIGPQGSGKGTQAKMLAEKTGAIYVGTGSMFRKFAKEDTEFGRYIRDLLDSGLLASDADVEKVLHSKLDNIETDQVVIFDGVPRRLSQAEFLINYMRVSGKSDILTFSITLSKEDAIQRMSARRVCTKCDLPTALLESMSPEDCKKCGGDLMQRADDYPEAINRRLEIYYRDTIPVLEYLKKNGQFYELDGTRSIEEVQAEINKILGLQ